MLPQSQEVMATYMEGASGTVRKGGREGGKEGGREAHTCVPSTVGGDTPTEPGCNGDIHGGGVGHVGEGEDAVEALFEEGLWGGGREGREGGREGV